MSRTGALAGRCAWCGGEEQRLLPAVDHITGETLRDRGLLQLRARPHRPGAGGPAPLLPDRLLRLRRDPFQPAGGVRHQHLAAGSGGRHPPLPPRTGRGPRRRLRPRPDAGRAGAPRLARGRRRDERRRLPPCPRGPRPRRPGRRPGRLQVSRPAPSTSSASSTSSSTSATRATPWPRRAGSSSRVGGFSSRCPTSAASSPALPAAAGSTSTRPRHLFHFTRAALLAALERASFEPARVATHSFEFGYYGMLQSLLNLVTRRQNALYEMLKNRTARPPGLGRGRLGDNPGPASAAGCRHPATRSDRRPGRPGSGAAGRGPAPVRLAQPLLLGGGRRLPRARRRRAGRLAPLRADEQPPGAGLLHLLRDLAAAAQAGPGRRLRLHDPEALPGPGDRRSGRATSSSCPTSCRPG